MRIFLLIILACFLYFKSIAQGEFNQFFIGERFNVYNGAVHHQLWSVFDFMIAHRDSFKIDLSELAALNKAKESCLPSVFFLHEDVYWSMQSISIVQVNKEHTLLLSDSVSLGDYFQKQEGHPKFDYYQDSEFKTPLFISEYPSYFFSSISHFKIKENWTYNKQTNKLENRVLAIALCQQTKEISRELWVYFPKIKGQIKYDFPNNNLIKKIEERKFSLLNIEIHPVQFFAEDGFNYLDLESLILFSMLSNQLELSGELKEKNISEVSLLSNCSYKGAFLKGYKNGKHLFYKANEPWLFFQTLEGKIQGDMVLNDDSGKLKSKINFIDGIRTGKAYLYNQDGTIKQELNFENGFYSGEQKGYYSNSRLKFVVNFNQAIINGKLCYYHPNGIEWYYGEMKDGLKMGKWSYNVFLSEQFQALLKRNIRFFDRRYNGVSKWKTKDLFGNSLKFNTNYIYYTSDNCLNQQCVELKFE